MDNFQDYYYRKYRVKLWSFEHFVCIFIYFLIFAVPFYFSFGGRNFWFEERFNLLQLQYTYTGYYAFEASILSSTGNQIKQYSNIPGSSMNTLPGLTVQIQESSSNVTIDILLNQIGTDQLQGINGAFFYEVTIPTFNKVLSVPYLFSMSGNILNSQIKGQMKVAVSQPINVLTETTSPTINIPSYFTINMKSPASYSQIIDAQFNNPYSISGQRFQHKSYNLNNNDISRKITIQLIKDTEIVLPYYPSILETLKLNFSRYVGFLILSYLILRNIMLIMIKDEGLQCNIKDEKMHIK